MERIWPLQSSERQQQLLFTGEEKEETKKKTKHHTTESFRNPSGSNLSCLRCYLVSVSAVCIYLSFQLGSAAIQQLNSGGKVTQRLTRDTSTKRRGFPLLPHKRSEEAFLTLPSSYPQMIEAHPLHARDRLTLTSGIHICFATHAGFQNLDDTSCNKCVTVKNLYLRKQRHKRM